MFDTTHRSEATTSESFQNNFIEFYWIFQGWLQNYSSHRKNHFTNFVGNLIVFNFDIYDFSHKINQKRVIYKKLKFNLHFFIVEWNILKNILNI